VLAVARKKSFRGAAVELAMSTTAISTTIGNLERHLGVRLFNRTTRSVSLTDAGKELRGPGGSRPARHSRRHGRCSFAARHPVLSTAHPVFENTGVLRAEGTLLHAGSRVASAEGKIFDAAGTLVAHGSETCLVMQAPR